MSLEVVAAIIFFENKILVTQRKFHKNADFSYKFEFPGGKVENNEDKITALRREIDTMAKNLRKFGLVSVSRTGAVAMTRGEKVFK